MNTGEQLRIIPPTTYLTELDLVYLHAIHSIVCADPSIRTITSDEILKHVCHPSPETLRELRSAEKALEACSHLTGMAIFASSREHICVLRHIVYATFDIEHWEDEDGTDQISFSMSLILPFEGEDARSACGLLTSGFN